MAKDKEKSKSKKIGDILGKDKKNPWIPDDVIEYTEKGNSEGKTEGEMEEPDGRKNRWKLKKGWSEIDMVLEREEDNELVIVPKEQWGGVAARWTRKMGPPYEVFHSTDTGTEECFEREACIKVLQKLQDFHMTEMNLPDIAWNFLFASDGTIYEGRGWENEGYKPHTVKQEFGKQTLVELGFIGDFKRRELHTQMDLARHLFIKRAIKDGKVPVKHIVTTIQRDKEVY